MEGISGEERRAVRASSEHAETPNALCADNNLGTRVAA